MEQLQSTIINGVISILVVLIGLAFNQLRVFISHKAEEVKANTSAKQYELIKFIAATAVQAVEQIAEKAELTSPEKFEKADHILTSELAKQGITISDDSKRTLIEACVNGMNSLKTIDF